ncbi:MAG: M48 family metallopeptidase [Gammaproteobacteria bacterium]|jgi:Zn-dependent protease with chaperone function|nr:M48 family metallopeptidase [Gammaproteobacteria bacterium]MBT3724572.1 M48 family metallopeptidase [Gammaproteobacteria bacterium]MBT4077107.1 M48 family metallopeptidase [Gammaproteobacteria bacterium]MBT4195217.1 M48 family metallopeptidase [Gammaproteobacteria bacterium]MBT4448555.1 M48 family metallopeptidase [Gammaproteobacteria bacterium]
MNMDVKAQVDGSFFTQGSSDRQPALLTVNEIGRVSVIQTGNSRAERLSASLLSAGNLNELDISPRLGNTPRHIGFADGSSFETSHNDEIDKLLVAFRQGAFHRFIHLLESHILIVLLVLVLVSGFLWGSIKYGVPAVAKFSAEILPVEITQYLGQGTLDILDKSVFEPSALSQQRQNELARKFVGYIPQYASFGITVEFRQGKEVGANALALPDGKIIFTDELVALSQNDLELLAIFAHEVGHVAHRHVLRRIIQDSLLAVLVLMMTGDVSSASSIVYAIPSLLLELSYSREFESDADDFAYEFLVQNEIETIHFANIMTRLMESANKVDNTNEAELTAADHSDHDERNGFENMLPYLSTHPATKKRIQIFQKN